MSDTPAPAPQGNPNPDPNLNAETPPIAAAPDVPAAPPNPDTPPPDPKPDTTGWGEQWREDYAIKAATVDGKLDEKQRDKVLARLKRFPTAKEALDWAFNADKKISDGSYKKPLSDKATPEEITEYRKANGIPDDPAQYFDKLPDGIVIGEEDKPVFDGFAKALHAVNADPKVAQAAAKWYYEWQDQMEGAMHEANVAAKAATEDAMREEWGPDFRPNINLVNSLVGSMPKELQDELYQSTTPSGKQVMNNPAMMKWLAQQARDLNYSGAVLPSGGVNAKDIDTEINELLSQSHDRNSDYRKGPPHPTRKGETVKSGRLLELYEIKERQNQRKAG